MPGVFIACNISSIFFVSQKKCEKYWPEEINETVEFNDISITMVTSVDYY